MEQRITAAANIRTAYERGPRRPTAPFSTAALRKARDSMWTSSAGRRGCPASRTWTVSHAARSLQPRAVHCSSRS
jgi:hypothetical protein